LTTRRFPPPWSVEEGDNYFVVHDREGQQLAYVHFDNPSAAAKPLTRDEARRIAANIAKLPDCPRTNLSLVPDRQHKNVPGSRDPQRNRGLPRGFLPGMGLV